MCKNKEYPLHEYELNHYELNAHSSLWLTNGKPITPRDYDNNSPLILSWLGLYIISVFTVTFKVISLYWGNRMAAPVSVQHHKIRAYKSHRGTLGTDDISQTYQQRPIMNIETWSFIPFYTRWQLHHYDDVIMTMLASQITSLPVVCSIVYSDVNQRKHQSSASLAFVREIHRGPVNFPHKWPVTRKMFPFDDVIMI